MAPMFLVSDGEMMKAAIRSGIMGVFPSLNFRKEGALEATLSELNTLLAAGMPGSYGVNLIVQKTNPMLDKHLEVCVRNKVPFFITSLGNPSKVIKAAHSYGAKVYCDVTNTEHAEKCAKLGCDGFIAVGHGAGGHAGPYPLHVLVPALVSRYPDIPVIAAGGIATGAGLASMLVLGASGVSVGTRFIASTEAPVSNEYKQAILRAGLGDIVSTERLSGTPCNIIDTPFARKIGYSQSWLEKKLSSNTTTRKYFKMLIQLQGMKKLEKSVKPGNYSNLWSAGQSSELIHEILTCENITVKLMEEYREAAGRLAI